MDVIWRCASELGLEPGRNARRPRTTQPALATGSKRASNQHRKD